MNVPLAPLIPPNRHTKRQTGRHRRQAPQAGTAGRHRRQASQGRHRRQAWQAAGTVGGHGRRTRRLGTASRQAAGMTGGHGGQPQQAGTAGKRRIDVQETTYTVKKTASFAID